MYFPPPSSTIFWLMSLRHMVAVFFELGPVQQQRRCLSARTERASVVRMVMERRISSDSDFWSLTLGRYNSWLGGRKERVCEGRSRTVVGYIIDIQDGR